jgi:hypothetical protein
MKCSILTWVGRTTSRVSLRHSGHYWVHCPGPSWSLDDNARVRSFQLEALLVLTGSAFAKPDVFIPCPIKLGLWHGIAHCHFYVVHQQGQQSFHYWSQLGPQLSFWPSPHFPWEASYSWHASSAVQSISSQWSGYPLHQETNFSLAASRLSQGAPRVFGCFTAVEDPAFGFSSPDGESTSLRLLTVGYQQQPS